MAPDPLDEKLSFAPNPEGRYTGPDMDDEKNSAGPTSRVPPAQQDFDEAGQRTESPDASPDSDSLVPSTLAGAPISQSRAWEILHRGQRSEKVRLLSLLLCYADWDEIWYVTDKATVRSFFPSLDLPTSLRRAWARYLDVPIED